MAATSLLRKSISISRSSAKLDAGLKIPQGDANAENDEAAFAAHSGCSEISIIAPIPIERMRYDPTLLFASQHPASVECY